MNAGQFPMSDLAEGDYVGRVDAVFFTQGGMGNQWTVIDGKRYVTYWDVRTKDWRQGDHVRFTVSQRKFGYDNHGPAPKSPHANSIHRVEKVGGAWALMPARVAT